MMEMASVSPPSPLSRAISSMSAGGHCFPREGGWLERGGCRWLSLSGPVFLELWWHNEEKAK